MASDYELIEFGPDGQTRYCIMEATTQEQAAEFAALLQEFKGHRCIARPINSSRLIEAARISRAKRTN